MLVLPTVISIIKTFFDVGFFKQLVLELPYQGLLVEALQ